MNTPGPPPTHSSQNKVVLKAVIAAVLTTLIVAGILFYLFYRYYVIRRWKKNKLNSSFRREVPHQEFQQGGALKGLIVDENGLDVIYWRRFEGRQLGSCFSKVWVNHMDEEEEKKIDSGRGQSVSSSDHIHEIPLLQNCSNVDSYEKKEAITESQQTINSHSVDSRSSPRQPSTALQFQQKEVIPPEETPSQPAVVSSQSPPQPPIPPPPPPPPLPVKRITKAPTPPNAGKIKPSPPPPPPPKGGGLSSPIKPPIAPRGKGSRQEKAEAQNDDKSKDNCEIQVKLRPLHWDKVVANADHSMVWDEINNGSFRFEDELMEVLFGYNATSKRTPQGNNSATTSSGSSKLAQPTQMFILDPRKSQNTAIVLKSLSISRKEILDALQEGQGLSVDTLEKLTKIHPTEEEMLKILQFDGNIRKLADAESFLYQMLKAFPSAFKRFNAMLFRSSYDLEILNLKENLQTIELSCKELRTSRIFLRLLEAILKAGNRMNAGTARGNAQGFNLTALQKLSYVKSNDGKTTLLHFVVEQVICSEGKRCLINKGSEEDNEDSDRKKEKVDKDTQHLMLGLPVLQGLGLEFSNVKKAATIDYDSFINTCPNLTTRVNDVRQLITCCGNAERDQFVRETKGFLEECEEELKVIREEQTRVMELVKRTTEYYQAGSSKNTQSLQLFAIVKDFLDMVDKVCVDITKKVQKKNASSIESSPPRLPTPRAPVRFHNLKTYFTPEIVSSESENEF
ncbi:Formin-like protein 8 [Capsicum annuum]|uniref:formin-like protein 4 n=1 Tax=Capsicum annuum TaxID=4072 RepID=UPI0007BF385E|nr:formin-like protein 4 [Capsicum annuum]KAF3614530.1 Formin-like protein 8 [Capsicum annuum]